METVIKYFGGAILAMIVVFALAQVTKTVIQAPVTQNTMETMISSFYEKTTEVAGI